MVSINMFEVDNFNAPFVIAEIGVNHNGDVEIAKKLVKEAAHAGAHAVKFQLWTKDSLYADSFLVDKPDFEKGLEEYSLTKDEYRELANLCQKESILFSATPFSKEEVDFLVELNTAFIKVASMDVNNYPFLDYIARKDLPIILSTGFAHLSEITKAIETIRAAGNDDIVLLHCVSDYPPADKELDLDNITFFMDIFDLPVGYSDHAEDLLPCIVAGAKGAAVIEKHFTLSRDMEGWDHKVSADPVMLEELIAVLDRIPVVNGSYERIVSDDQIEKRKNFRRSIVATQDIKSGNKFTPENITLKRPGTGFAPENLEMILGMTSKNPIKTGELIKNEDIKG